MDFIKWTESLSVNVAAIDSQHKALVKMVNDFHEAIMQKKSKESMGKLLEGLQAYAASHFATEEKYFKQYGYPEAASHIEEHRKIALKVGEMKQRYDKGQMLLTLEFANFLKDWLSSHIQGSDKKYSAFFNSKGLR